MMYVKTLIALLIWCSIFVTSAQEHSQLKVMVWNILHGGQSKGLPHDGRPSVAAIIKKTQADVILMIETYGIAPYLAKELGFEYRLLSSNLCIFSRYPIVETYTFGNRINTFNFGGVKLNVSGKEIVVFDTWLHYLPDTRLVPVTKSEAEILAWETNGSRDDEIKTILNVIQPFLENADTVPVFLGGDLNSHSHLDWTEETKDLAYHGGKVVRWTISKAITEAGMIDSFRFCHPYPAIYPGVTWLVWHPKKGEDLFSRQDRIDYLYYKGKNVKAIASYSEIAPEGNSFYFKGSEFMYPSDHGFVVSTFELR